MSVKHGKCLGLLFGVSRTSRTTGAVFPRPLLAHFECDSNCFVMCTRLVLGMKEALCFADTHVCPLAALSRANLASADACLPVPATDARGYNPSSMDLKMTSRLPTALMQSKVQHASELASAPLHGRRLPTHRTSLLRCMLGTLPPSCQPSLGPRYTYNPHIEQLPCSLEGLSNRWRCTAAMAKESTASRR